VAGRRDIGLRIPDKELLMRYAMLVYETEAGVEARNDPEYQAAYKAYIDAIYGTGVAVGGSGLQDAATTATTFRLVDGQRLIQDGPFPDTKEQLAGFFLIDVPDLDRALEWAARCPSTTRGGIIELRPRSNNRRDDPSKIEEAMLGIRRSAAVLDARLAGKQYVVGNALTIADLTLACSLMYAKQTDAPLADFVNLQSWFSRISEMNAWQKTNPQ
jgi:hypothetical protein